MKVDLNWAHVQTWQRFLGWWVAYIGFVLVAGWVRGITPRPDELAFVLCVPLLVAVPWALLNLAVAYIALRLIPAARGWREQRRRLPRNGSDQGPDAARAGLDDKALARLR